jgi:hypothetical protein
MVTLPELTQEEWATLALDVARDVHEENLESRRGLYILGGLALVYYDNNSFEKDTDARERLISNYREYLKQTNLATEMASAYWPISGEEQDYTFAMVMKGHERHFNIVANAFQRVMDGFMAEYLASQSKQ